MHASTTALSRSLAAAAIMVPVNFGLATGPADGDAIRATVAEMMADAETRSGLLSAGDAGHDGSFFIAGDGFRLNVNGNIQVRYIADFRNDTPTDDGFESGFQTRRTQLWFTGNISKDWFYRVQGGFNRDGGTFTAEDVFAGYTFANGWNLAVGQTWAPFLRESLMDEWRQLAVDSSIVESFFGAGRAQGAWAQHTGEDWWIMAGLWDGTRTVNTDFTSPAEADYSLMGRVQYKCAGAWSQFDDFTSPRGREFACMFGAAVTWQQSSNTSNPADVDTNALGYTIDISIEGDGWNAFAAFVGSYTDTSSLSSDSDAVNNFGAVIQGGVMITDKTELFARWEGIFLDSDQGLDEDNFNFVTAGFNWYIAGQAAKLSFDGIYSFDRTDALVGLGVLPDTGLGILGSSDEGEVTLRAQFQLLF